MLDSLLHLRELWLLLWITTLLLVLHSHRCFLHQHQQNDVGDLLEMQILGPHPRPDEAEAPGEGPAMGLMCSVRVLHDKLILLTPARPVASITEGMGQWADGMGAGLGSGWGS